MKKIHSQTIHPNQASSSAAAHGSLYEICVKGQLDSSWSDWLEDLEVRLLDNEKMLLSGYIVDQAALMGVLNKLYSLNLSLLSLKQIQD